MALVIGLVPTAASATGPGAAIAGGSAVASAAAWSRPVQLVAPFSLDLLAPQLAFSSSGVAAVGFAVQDGDDAADSTAYLAARGVTGGPVSLHRITGAKQVLALAYQKATADLLLGTAPSAQTCCSAVAFATRRAGGAVSAPHQLLGSLAGATTAQLVPVSTRLLAVVATERGVWVTESAPRSTRFGGARRLTAGAAVPETVSALGLGGGGAAVLWAARGGGSGVTGAGPGWIIMATGTPKRAPSNPRAVIRLPAGHTVEELAAVPSATGVTVAWIESWFDGGGNYHSVARAADISRHTAARTLSPGNELATGLSLVADGRSDALMTWEGCTSAGTCTVRAARRPAKGHFTTAQLGAVDASEQPAAAIAPSGTAIVGWVSSGHVYAASAGVRARTFGPAARVSATNYATDLTVGVAPTGVALAAWTQGTFAQSVMGATLRVR